ncbi:MAG: Clp protease N-terminal domain-containing protein, partial [Lactococcus hircilactis]
MNDYDVELTPIAIKIIEKATDLAYQYEFGVIESGHLLSAMANTPGSIAYSILMSQNIDPEDMLLDLEEISSHIKTKRSEITFSPRLQEIIEVASNIALLNDSEQIGTEHLLYAMLQHDQGSAIQLLNLQKVGHKALRDELKKKTQLRTPKPKKAVTPMSKRELNQGIDENSNTPTLDTVSINLTQAAREGKLDPMIGREKEIERLIHILSRRTKNNPVLVGEPGVGKTAIIEGLA